MAFIAVDWMVRIVMRGGLILLWLTVLAWGTEKALWNVDPMGLVSLNQSVPYTGKAERKHFDGTLFRVYYREGNSMADAILYPNGTRSAFQP